MALSAIIGSTQVLVKQALISVSDKTGVVELARALAQMNISILSTGGTATLLSQNGIPVEEVAEYTGYPEMLDGRLKTLHPMIHGGLLARRDVPEHMAAIKDAGIRPIDLFVGGLYPFTQTIAMSRCTYAAAIENIDIGGPTMLRSAAKNNSGVVVVINSADYPSVLAEMRACDGTVSAKTRFRLAKKVFSITTAYDAAIEAYLSGIGTVHGLDAGYSLCDFSRYFIGCDFSGRMLKDWPEGHTGVRYDCLKEITCPDCTEEAIGMIMRQGS